MKLQVSYRRDAVNEMIAASEWLDSQRPGSLRAFIDAVESIVDLIWTDPRRFAIEFQDVRMAPVPDYSYVIVYRIEPDRIRIVSVFHTSRDPAIWQSRL